MSTIDVNNTIMQMQNDTSVAEAASSKAGVKKMDADMFLKLMLEQLKYQDPMDPVDNKEFLAQQAQFTQVSETQELNNSISKNNTIMQTLALVGKEVVMVDPNNPKKTISGTVTEASFDSKDSAIVVNGKQYPVSLVQSVRTAGAAPATSQVTAATNAVKTVAKETSTAASSTASEVSAAAEAATKKLTDAASAVAKAAYDAVKEAMSSSSST